LEDTFGSSANNVVLAGWEKVVLEDHQTWHSAWRRGFVNELTDALD
jgi:hypothetical protein